MLTWRHIQLSYIGLSGNKSISFAVFLAAGEEYVVFVTRDEAWHDLRFIILKVGKRDMRQINILMLRG
jgi:hypothetical protein